MDHLAPIAGVTVEQYADLCAQMASTGEDTAAQAEIAAKNGVDEATWNAAKEGWTKRMSDPANMGKVAQAFMEKYQAAQAAARGGKEPMSLQQYAKITAEYSFEKDANGVQVDHHIILARYGLNVTQWGEVSGYWTPRVNDPADPSATTFRALLQSESDRIFGIVRTPPGQSAAKPAAAPAPSAPAPQITAIAPEADAGGLFAWLLKLIQSFFG